MLFLSKYEKIKIWIIDIIVVLFGTAIDSAGVYFFTAAADIAPGGVVGIATVLNKTLGFPIGTVSLAINVPLIILGFIYLGKKLIIKTIISLLAFTVFVDYIFPMFPSYQGETLMCAIFGGVLIGAGLGIVYTREATTGGMDIVNRLIQKGMPHVKLGTIIFCTDAAVIAFATIAFRNINIGLYSAIATFLSAKVIDSVIYGTARCKLLFIVTERPHAISEEILKMHRGVTIMNAHGAYTNTDKSVIMCATAKNQYYKVRKIVTQNDEKAFIIITDAGQVLGNGFLPLGG